MQSGSIDNFLHTHLESDPKSISALSQLFHTIFVKLNQTCKFVHINILRGGTIDIYFQSGPFPLLITFMSLVFYSNQISMAAFSAIIVSSFE